MSDDALDAARLARRELDLAQTRTGAWYALLAVELDPSNGLGWSLLARIVLGTNEDPLGTLVTARALELGVPDPEREEVERDHRVDLWTRGLLAHSDEAAILPLTAFSDDDPFQRTSRADAWWQEQLEEAEGVEAACRSVARMVAALSEAWVVPETDANPLRSPEPWRRTEAFTRWVESEPVRPGKDSSKREESPPDLEKITVLSDYWIEQEIWKLGAQGRFDLALDQARLWTTLRSGRTKPRTVLARVLHARGDTEERDEVVRELIEAPVRDLNELEEARVVLGELELWAPQIAVLDRMAEFAPDHPTILANRGVAYLQLGRGDDGAHDLERAIELMPDHGPALANLGLHRMREDEYVAARDLLKRAVEVAPEEPQARLYLAVCMNNQGDREGALEALRRVLELDPEHSQARQLLRELEDHDTKR